MVKPAELGTLSSERIRFVRDQPEDVILVRYDV